MYPNLHKSNGPATAIQRCGISNDNWSSLELGHPVPQQSLLAPAPRYLLTDRVREIRAPPRWPLPSRELSEGFSASSRFVCQCQIRGFRGGRGDSSTNRFSKLLAGLRSSLRVPPFPHQISRFFSPFRVSGRALLTNLLPNGLPGRGGAGQTAARTKSLRRVWRCGQTMGCAGVAGFAGACSGAFAEALSRRFIASRMAVISAYTAPSVHAAYTENMVVSRWPCSLATNSGLRPIMRFQLTEVWRAI